jgi:hypothetical protein
MKAKPKYRTSAQLGILPEERKALIAFVQAPAQGGVITVDGHKHFYAQHTVQSWAAAKATGCRTAGCVAGFVWEHVTRVQRCKTLRGRYEALDYFCVCVRHEPAPAVFLADLYSDANWAISLVQARQVVDRALRTGKVKWPLRKD